MTLGERIRQVRRQKGLSQSALAGEAITRNMLSLIESGRAQPSVPTLLYLAERLGVPAGTLLEDAQGDDAVRAEAETACRAGDDAACLACVLREKRAGEELRALGAMAAVRLARQALLDAQPARAASLLEQARTLGAGSLYWDASQAQVPAALASLYAGREVQPPQEDPLLPVLRARLALHQGDAARAAAEPVSQPFEAALIAGLALVQQGRTQEALAKLQYAEQLLPPAAEPSRMRELFAALETCCQKLEDYQGAYRYASRQLKLAEKP